MKRLACRDAGFDCEGVIEATTEQEVLEKAAVHASDVHGISVTPEMAQQLKTLIRDEETQAE